MTIKERVEAVFNEWGMPSAIRVDNGLPFGGAGSAVVPAMALWLIGIGIEVRWNTPRRPQENAKVERSQGTLGNWAEAQRLSSVEDLSKRLKRDIKFYNESFPQGRKGGKTKLEQFPELLVNTRRLDENKFELNRVMEYLSSKTYERVSSSNGQIFIYNHRFSVGAAYKKKVVTIKLDPSNNEWVVLNSDNEVIKREPTRLTKDNICAMKI